MSPRLDRLWYVIDAETKSFDEGIVRSGEKLRSFTEYAAGHPLVVLGALGAAAVVAGGKMLRMAEDYEKSMKMVQTVTDTTQVSMADLSNGVLKTFESLPITSLDEMTKGLYDIISSGVPAGQAIEYLNTAAQAAVGGVTSVAVAVDGLTSATNAWVAQGLTVTEASDQMFQAVNKGKMTFEQLAGSIGTVSAMAAGLNVPLADVLAIVAQLTLNGMSTAEAMTAVRSALTNIVKPTGQLQQQFPDLARQFTRARLEGEGLVGFLLDFQKATGGNGAAITALFSDVQALNGVMGVLRDGGEGVAQMLDDVKHSSGAAAAAAKTMGSSAIDTEQTLKNKLHAELVRGGSVLLPAWMAAIKGATALLKAFNDEANNTRQLNVAKDVAARADAFVQASMGSNPNSNDARAMRNDLVDLFEDIKNGAVDTTKLTTAELKNIQRAYAVDLAASAGLTIEEFARTRAELLRRSGGRAQPSDNMTSAYDYLTILTTKRQREEAAAAAAAKKDAAARLAGLQQEGEQLANVASASAKAAESYKGMGDEATRAQTARSGALAAIADAERQIGEAQAKLRTAVEAHDEAGAKAAVAQLRAAQTQINDQHQVLTTAGEQLTQASKRAESARANILSTIAQFAQQGLKDPIAEAETRIAALEVEARNAHATFTEFEKAAIRSGAAIVAARDARAMLDELQTQLITVAGTAAQQAQRSGADLVRQLTERVALSRELTAEQKAQAQEMIAQIAAASSINVTLAKLQQESDALSLRGEERSARGLLPDAHDVASTIALAVQYNAILHDASATDAQRAQAQRALLAIDQTRLANLIKITNQTNLIAAAEARLRQMETERLRDQAHAIETSVQMATQLASAFGLVDESVGQTIQTIAQIGTSIAPMLDELDKFRSAMTDGQGNPLATLSSVLGSAVPIVGGIASLISNVFGAHEDPAVVAARNANTEALRELTRHVGDLAKATVSGNSLLTGTAGAQAAIAKYEGDIQRLLDLGKQTHDASAINEALRQRATLDKKKLDLSDPKLAAAVAAAGSSVAELQDLANAYHLTLTSLGDLKKLLEAIKGADLAAYTDTFVGSLEQLSDHLRAYAITDPTEKLRLTIATLTNPNTGIPALAGALAGIDTSTAEGAAAAITKLQQLLDAIGSGAITDPSQFGGASIDETRQAILDLLDQLRGESTGTSGFNVSQQITEVTGNRLVAIADTSRIFLEQISGNTAVMTHLLGGTPVVPPLLPPAASGVFPMPGSGSDTGHGSISVGDVTVNVSVPGSATVHDAETIGGQVSQAAAEAIDRALGTQLQWRARGRGAVTR